VQAQHAERQHALGAVEQAETLLGPQAQRFQAVLRQRLGGGSDLPVDPDEPLSYQRKRQMGERGQVARSPHRSLAGDHRQQAQPEQIEQSLDHYRPHPRVALRQAACPQQKHRLHQLIGYGVPHSGGVAAQQLQLELIGPGRVDAGRCERSEPRGDAVDGLTVFDDLLDQSRGGRHAIRRPGVRPPRRAQPRRPPAPARAVPHPARSDRSYLPFRHARPRLPGGP